ncbi:microtubule-associated protein futsch isoform X2 [Phlebotomus argentipes]|nr:microtubule-associated protein futsch isoform X2 [Phlebotomus argentipes]
MESSGSGEGRLPEIREHPATSSGMPGVGSATTSRGGPNLGVGMSHPTPRIDISRASSSSHQDSRDSSPENVFEQIGTGTLQESAPFGLGFGEDGALELRSSTEELYFMEPEKGMTEREKPSQQGASQSPIMFKFDEQQQACLQQNQRKDSASSEVAALLCISGRTSRISSVGSQGSAASRLSAVSGVSRSPSPHRMLLETSFCGPKPLDGALEGGIVMSTEPPTVETLEHIILARKQDPTQAVLAEGIKIDLSTPKKSNGTIIESTAKRKEPFRTTPGAGGSVIRGALAKKTAAAFGRREPPKAILGVTKSGTEYIRIKLKPDHLYQDNGLAENETVIDAPLSEVLKKPLSLSLKPQETKRTDEISRHPEQKALASPKPARHTALARDSGSRSPSPATVTISRKSSFCSLFKTKEAAGSPESPTIFHRKKSKEPDDVTTPSRSRSKSGDRGTPVQASVTPSKQKSVLAIFKPRRSGSKSKSTSPVEPDPMSGIEMTNVEFQFDATGQPPRPKSKLRYYDTPLDGTTIHIPLHTPPDEKDDFRALPSQPPLITSAPKPNYESIHPAPLPEKPKDAPKSHRIEYPDGSIRIPLHSPTEEKERESLWSVEAQRHSSQESQETVISTQVALERPRKASKPSLTDTEPLPVVENGLVIGAEIPSAPSAPPPTPASATVGVREKKHIVFTTKIGSGSEEQLFCTQFSLSKTESLSSQLSEQASQMESPKEAQKSDSMRREETPPKLIMRRQKDSSGESGRKSKSSSQSTESIKEEPVATQCSVTSVTVQMPQQSKLREEAINTHRHSRYIENIDQIMEEQRKIHMAMQQSKRLDPQPEEEVTKPQETSKPSSTEEPLKDESVKLESKVEESVQKKASPRLESLRGSSESDREDGTDATEIRGKHHLTRSIAEDHESAGLVSQESYDDELPYVPTTLPEERSMGVTIIPVKERAHMELRMCPVERPRSTTPINPSCLEEYCGTPGAETPEPPTPKLRISLPRRDSRGEIKGCKSKSPRRISTPSGKSWFEFAEQGIKGVVGEGSRRSSGQPDDDTPPPPLPPRKGQAPTQWINFENIPEKRKPPKRITTLPGAKDSRSGTPPQPVQYNYVNPEECQCECHESERDGGSVSRPADSEEDEQALPEDAQPLLDEGEPADAEGISDSTMDRLLSGSRSSGSGRPFTRK